MAALREPLKPRLRDWVDALTLAAASESNLDSRSGIGIPLATLLSERSSERWQALRTSLLPPRWNLMKRYPRLAASPFYPLCYVLLNVDRSVQVSKKLLRMKSHA